MDLTFGHFNFDNFLQADVTGKLVLVFAVVNRSSGTSENKGTKDYI